MRKPPMLRTVALAVIFTSAIIAQASASYLVEFDFNTGWSGDYAPGWENSAYRHGAPPVGKMMDYTSEGVGGSGAMRLIADSTPEDWMWWAAVNPIDVDGAAMVKQYNPWVSVDYFDEGWDPNSDLQDAGQLYAVPSWVNPYLPNAEDWTDVQLGARMNQGPPNDDYYYVAAGQNSPGWQGTGVARRNGDWVNLMMQLNSQDGRIHFFVNGNDVGTSYRNDYTDLIGMGLYTMFTDPLEDWGTAEPSALYDNFRFGSDVPEPNTVILLVGCGLAALVTRRLRKR